MRGGSRSLPGRTHRTQNECVPGPWSPSPKRVESAGIRSSEQTPRTELCQIPFRTALDHRCTHVGTHRHGVRRSTSTRSREAATRSQRCSEAHSTRAGMTRAGMSHHDAKPLGVGRQLRPSTNSMSNKVSHHLPPLRGRFWEMMQQMHYRQKVRRVPKWFEDRHRPRARHHSFTVSQYHSFFVSHQEFTVLLDNCTVCQPVCQQAENPLVRDPKFPGSWLQKLRSATYDCVILRYYM